jgi:phosphoglycerol transferase MdoB-like AlkP superfamily enzyme
MAQTKKASLAEAVTNIFVGYSVNFAANLLVFPIFGWHVSVKQNLQLGVIYTVISLVRSYGLRRYYNWREVRRAA